PDGQVLAPAVSGDGEVMVHAALGDDGSLALVIVDLRDPAASESVPVEISSPSGLPEAMPTSWQLPGGSRLSGDALDSAESALTAPTELDGAFPETGLGDADPLTVTSDPGSTTLLQLSPGTAEMPA